MFTSDEERRKHFLGILREKLKDPEFRKTPGFPRGSDEDVLRLSDPPYYTACPNPFLEDFVRCYGKPYDPSEPYHREPFAVDVSESKTDALYKAHGYHTKVPHLAIVPSILHYTKPGDIVLDGFCGSGMTGVAAQWCGAAPAEYRHKLAQEWRAAGLGAPEWGACRAILGDLSPAGTFIAANYNLPFDVRAFEKAAKRILKEVDDEIGWMYETLHTDGKTKLVGRMRDRAIRHFAPTEHSKLQEGAGIVGPRDASREAAKPLSRSALRGLTLGRRARRDQLVECPALRLVLQDGEQCGGIYDHQEGRPWSSYPRISLADLASSTGRLAACRAIRSRSSASRRPLGAWFKLTASIDVGCSTDPGGRLSGAPTEDVSDLSGPSGIP